MLLQSLREQVALFSQKMLRSGLTHGTGGNISALDRASGLIAITPSGIDYEAITTRDICVVNGAGKQIDGIYTPSSELEMHLLCYARRPEFAAVVHTHSTFATVLSCMHRSLPAIHYLIGYVGGEVRCMDYALFGSHALAESAVNGLKDRRAVLLGNHGLLSAGPSLEYAFSVAEETEFTAKIYYYTQAAGGGVCLTSEELEEAILRFKNYGQKKEVF